jgi:SpoIID/LytB domain protein
LEQKKKQLEGEKVRLSKIKEETNSQAKFLEKEIGGAKKYQMQLSSQIAHLSTRQQELLAQKLASLNLPTSLGGGPLYCTDDRKLDPPFRPAFAFFTFGIPHRVGLNQYGAYGRAKVGQNYQDILHAYYDNVSFTKRDANTKIKVQGYGEMKLEDYLLGIYEMPGDWPKEALKAQVVAARSYALAFTNNGKDEICTTQACQVYKGGNKGGDWERAVKETEGEIMMAGGEIVKAWFASTFGGYTFTSGDVWSSNKSWTKRSRDANGDITSFSDLFAKAYDRDSPCFYAAQGFRNEYAKSAWLKESEVADIVNVLLLAKKDNGTQSHLSQSDKPNPDGTDTWDEGRVKTELRNKGVTPYNSISDISIDWDKGLGKTTNIIISGDGGRNTFDGEEFKSFFNLRAPANIQVVGPLYNIEKK